MPPVIGYSIAIAVLVIVTFFCGRSMIRNIKAELKGEGTCAGCSKAGTCSAAGPGSSGCQACLAKIEELKKLADKKRSGEQNQ